MAKYVEIVQERIIFDTLTQMNADNPDFKYNVCVNSMMIELNFGTKPEVKRKGSPSK